MSEPEHLAVRSGSFTMFGVAVIYAKVLVFVRGFDMQVRLTPAAVQVYGRHRLQFFAGMRKTNYSASSIIQASWGQAKNVQIAKVTY